MSATRNLYVLDADASLPGQFDHPDGQIHADHFRGSEPAWQATPRKARSRNPATRISLSAEIVVES